MLYKNYDISGCAHKISSYTDLVVEAIKSVLYIKIFEIPIIIIWIILFGVFCTLRFRFVNIKLFSHALMILFGKYDKNKSKGAITHLQAFFTSISGTIGLGTISGVAIAISMGGPGAIFWMAIVGVLGMSTKFAEVILAFKYRDYSDQNVKGGPFYYMKKGFAELGYKKLGKFLAIFYALLLLIAMAFGGIPFQANQTVVVFNNLFIRIDIELISLFLTILVSLVIVGGIKRIATVTVKLAPIMTLMYIVGCSIIIIMHRDRILDALTTIINQAFNFDSAAGGFVASFVAGVRRSVFANEAGIGTAAIAHSAAKDNQSARAGCSAMLEPCVDTILISCFTGLVFILTGDYLNPNSTGDIMLASKAFTSISYLFGFIVFPTIVFSFAFSTIITYSYYCEVAWTYLIGSDKGVYLCRALIVLLVYFSGMLNNVSTIASLGDLLFMSLTIPNALAVFALNGFVLKEIDLYLSKSDHKS